ncbi:transcriptional regulator, effector-binding domain/component [Aequorivita sublithincola DSM 14238]|uniref:Transcriptional regulator, effector-binding domain/component n=1 Tax=Aequorivita sublithincola (strain DSM 14238 / LMG 21431 / ACAM 643 / 9-3) TaxID=746697 RepID=I3YSC8_AEQSU|nr:SRPBCC family protein [Aequorivita sublithincola]AFL79896.1 transcriptional regulator, effector-binding domain/component [Aequorivita sublithincola DSM 14238]
MKILKYLLFLILLIIIGSAIYFGTKDGTYDVQDSITIMAPPEVVFNKVNDYKSWETWGPWKKEDPSITFTYAEKTSGEGASYSWDGDMSGSMTTTKVIPNKEIEQDLTLVTPAGERHPKVYWNFEEVDGGTKVTWGMKGEHTLIDKAYYSFSGMDFNAQMHKMNKEGLEGIALEVAEDMKQYSINVDGVTQYGGGYYMYTTSVAKQEEVDQKTEPMMNMVIDFVKTNNLNMAGKPFTLYNSIDNANNTVIFSTGVPVKEKVVTPEGSPVVCGFMEPVSAVKISLKGNYKHISEAYSKGEKYIVQNSLQKDPEGKMFEVYITDPEATPNPADWLTEIYIPIITSPEPVEEGI